ncbi:MAG: outer membrane protein transport protein, partial [Candidatus Omnitrophica bacterium]|nr:outer membrane protein transport protein [Candidatus Omnitrophota bacterium]
WRTFYKLNSTGDSNHNDFKPITIPSAYLTVNPGSLLNDRLALGVAVNSPFGLSNSYPSVSVGRYTGFKNSLKTLATTIAGSLKITDFLSVGGGAAQYRVFDYGQTANYPNSAVGAPGGDGLVRTDMSGHGYGWNAGVLIKPFKKHRLGASYRSRANVKVSGRGTIEDLGAGGANFLFPTLPHFETGIHSEVPIPANLTLGYAYEPSKKWSVEADVGITYWGAFKDQDIDFDAPNAVLTSLGTIPRDYKASLSIHLGGKRQVTDKLDWLGGFAFYQAPSPKNHFDNFLPDANRYLWTTGLSYRFKRWWTIDANYFFMLFGTRAISNPQVTAKSGVSIDGKYTSIIHGPMLSCNYQFGIAE